MKLSLSEQERYWLWLSSIEGVGQVRFYRLLTEFVDAQQVFERARELDFAGAGIPAKVAKHIIQSANHAYLDGLISQLEERGMGVLTPLSQNYPSELRDIPESPIVLYYLGNIQLLQGEKIAIVGTRKCSRTGSRCAYEVAKELASYDFCIVSGLARGIDAYAHRGALDGGGKTIAVLGCGADVIYPRQNEEIYHSIAQKGLILSEYLPGSLPLPGNFPVRNRIVSGLCRAVAVIEGERKSGAGITARQALEQGKDVFAVPGDIYKSQSQLPNYLIKTGALPLLSAEDILEFYGVELRSAENGQGLGHEPVQIKELDFLENQLYNLLLAGDFTLESILHQVDCPVSDVTVALSMLEIKGYIEKLPGKIYRLIK